MKVPVTWLIIFCISCNANENQLKEKSKLSKDSAFVEQFCKKLILDYKVDSIKSFRSDTTKRFPLTTLDILSVYCDKSIKDGVLYTIGKNIYFKSKDNSFAEAVIDFCIFQDSMSVGKAYQKLDKLNTADVSNTNFSICQFTWEQESISKYYKKNNILIIITLSGLTIFELEQMHSRCIQYLNNSFAARSPNGASMWMY